MPVHRGAPLRHWQYSPLAVRPAMAEPVAERRSRRASTAVATKATLSLIEQEAERSATPGRASKRARTDPAVVQDLVGPEWWESPKVVKGHRVRASYDVNGAATYFTGTVQRVEWKTKGPDWQQSDPPLLHIKFDEGDRDSLTADKVESATGASAATDAANGGDDDDGDDDEDEGNAGATGAAAAPAPSAAAGRSSWAAAEVERLVQLVAEHQILKQPAVSRWSQAASALGTGRSAGAVEQRYYLATRGRPSQRPGAARKTGTANWEPPDGAVSLPAEARDRPEDRTECPTCHRTFWYAQEFATHRCAQAAKCDADDCSAARSEHAEDAEEAEEGLEGPSRDEKYAELVSRMPARRDASCLDGFTLDELRFLLRQNGTPSHNMLKQQVVSGLMRLLSTSGLRAAHQAVAHPAAGAAASAPASSQAAALLSPDWKADPAFAALHPAIPQSNQSPPPWMSVRHRWQAQVPDGWIHKIV